MTTYTVSGLVQSSGITLNNGDVENVSDGGIAVATTVNAGGAANAGPGGRISGTIVNDGGYAAVFQQGTAIGTTVENGGTLYLQSGGVTNTTSLMSGGTEYVYSGVASGTAIASGGIEFVYSGGSAVGTNVASGGALIVAGGTATGTTAASGGAVVSSGVVLISGTSIAESSDTALLSLAVTGGEAAIVLSGGGVLFSVLNGGEEDIYSGGTDTGLVLAAGAQYVYAGGTAIGATVQAGAQQAVYAGGIASSTVVLSGGTQTVYAGADVTGSIVSSGGAIDLADLAFSSVGNVSLSASDLLTVNEGGQIVTLQLGGDYTGDYFHLTNDGFGDTLITVDGTPCYCRGTLIATERGEIPVEALRIGERVITHAGRKRPIRWIGQRSYDGRFASANPDVLPVLIRAGAVADGVPSRDLMVSPLHALFLDGALVPASSLVNGVSILQAGGIERVEYFHVELGSHDILMAEGMPAESFVDDDSRGMFLNAHDFHTRYPDQKPLRARYCAPHLEEGAALEALRLRIASRAAPAPAQVLGDDVGFEGFLDGVTHGRITGWAREAGSTAKARLRIIVNGTVIGEAVADLPRADLGASDCCFELIVPGGLSPDRRHVVEVRRASDGALLKRSPWILEARRPPVLVDRATGTAPARGHLDEVRRDYLRGWAQDDEGTATPVALVVLHDGEPIARVLANHHRGDLAAGGVGQGWHGFEIRLPGGLSPLSRHVISVRRESDGAELDGSPVVIEPADRFDNVLQRTVADAVSGIETADEGDRVLSFMVAQTERLLALRAEREGGHAERLAWQQFNRRWGSETEARANGAIDPGRRALMIDDRVPVAGRDAGSQAVLSHIAALQSLGYAVSLVAAGEMRADPAAAASLAACDVTLCGAPFYASVEDLLQRQADCFDVVYLHRVSVAAPYLALVRKHMRRARLIYAVADLHHVRLARQAEIEGRPELLGESRKLRLEECTAAWSADAVITHSQTEAALIRLAVPESVVHVVPWNVASRATEIAFAQRHDVAFIGSYAHAPNVDAACFLVSTVMPLVWRDAPDIGCLLVGDDPNDALAALAGPGVTMTGHVADLSQILDRVRLTVAPLRYGAGIKGKVLESLAVGVPCVMSPIAAEGIALPVELADLVGQDARAIADLILRLHVDEPLHSAMSEAGTRMIASQNAASVVRAALERAIGAPVSEPRVARQLQAG